MSVAAPPSPHVFDATEANFEAEVINASFEQPVLVDLWATWCGPCKVLGPLLEKVVDEFNGAVRLAKIDCDQEQALAASFGVRSIPTVVLVRTVPGVRGGRAARCRSSTACEIRSRMLSQTAGSIQKSPSANRPAPSTNRAFALRRINS